MNKQDKLFLQALKHNLKNGISLEQSLRNYGYINKADKGCQNCIRFETEELYKQIAILKQRREESNSNCLKYMKKYLAEDAKVKKALEIMKYLIELILENKGGNLSEAVDFIAENKGVSL